MKSLQALAFILVCGVAFVATSCASNKNEPPRSKVSSMPHNMPASWEANGGMPGMPTGQ